MTDITERLRDAARIHVELAGQSALAATINAGADEIDRLRARLAELEAADGICFTAMLVEIDGHAYGLRPGAARIVREALRKWGMIPLLLNALQVARDNIDTDLEPDDIALIDAAIDAAKDGA